MAERQDKYKSKRESEKRERQEGGEKERMRGKDIQREYFSFLLLYNHNFILRQKQWKICELERKEERRRGGKERGVRVAMADTFLYHHNFVLRQRER